MNIIEKLGITSIETIEVLSNSYDLCQEKPVREIEQQRNEMLEALIDEMIYSDNLIHDRTFANQYVDLSDKRLSFLASIRKLIQKADPQHRSWEEIKELNNE